MAQSISDTIDLAESSRKGSARSAESKAVRHHGYGASSSDREYSDDEIEFMLAMRSYIERTGRKFPMWSEALAVLKELGYAKPPAEDEGVDSGEGANPGEAAPPATVRVNGREFRARFGWYMRTGHRFVITKHDKDIAAVVPMADFWAMEGDSR